MKTQRIVLVLTVLAALALPAPAVAHGKHCKPRHSKHHACGHHHRATVERTTPAFPVEPHDVSPPAPVESPRDAGEYGEWPERPERPPTAADEAEEERLFAEEIAAEGGTITIEAD